MSCLARRSMLVAAVAAALACVPESAEAGRGRRGQVRDHRPTVYYRPHVRTHVYWHYYPHYYHPYHYPYYYDHGYYYGPPGTAVVYTPPPPPPRRVIALAVHLGSLAEDDTPAGTAGVALRLRGRVFEGELELGRRYYEDDTSERSVAATLYANLGRCDRFHPYLLGGVGLLESDRSFAQLGVGLALPLTSRLTLAADARLASISEPDREGATRSVVSDDDDDDGSNSLEGRLSLILDF